MQRHYNENDFPPHDEADHDNGEQAPEFEYEILKGHFEPDSRTWKSEKELRMEYVQLTDELIRKMTTGVSVENPETGETEVKVPTVAVFLDKSARPLSHLVRELWPVLARDPKTGEIPPMPQFKFLNIDREQWVNQIDPYGVGIMDIEHLRPSILNSLRSIFVEREYKDKIEQNGLNDAVNHMPSTLDGETVLIVDETLSTGRTAKIARAMMKRTFPKTAVAATHWMTSKFTKNGNEFNAVPVWYKTADRMGRGVSDRYVDVMEGRRLDETSEKDYYRKFGKFFLSAPHWLSVPEGETLRDEAYMQLVREIKELATNPDVPFIPSMKRDDFDERLLAYNGWDATKLSVKDEQNAIDQIIAEKRAINDASALEARKMPVPFTRKR